MITTPPSAGWLYACMCSWTAALATWTAPFDFVGVPVPVAFMAFAGACAGLVLQPPKVSRRAMYAWALCLTFFATVLTVALGEVPHMDWTKNAAPAIAGLLAVFSQALLPAISDRLRREVKDRGAPGNATGGDPP
jgi:phosphatidylserine synthase